MAFDKTPEGSEGKTIWGKNTSGRGNPEGKGLEVEVGLECPGNSKEASVHYYKVNKGKGGRI